jgi:hypothetical protein
LCCVALMHCAVLTAVVLQRRCVLQRRGLPKAMCISICRLRYAFVVGPCSDVFGLQVCEAVDISLQTRRHACCVVLRQSVPERVVPTQKDLRRSQKVIGGDGDCRRRYPLVYGVCPIRIAGRRRACECEWALSGAGVCVCVLLPCIAR